MNSIPIQAFQCPRCSKIYDNIYNSNKCIDKHLKEDERKKIEAERAKSEKEKKDYIRLNAESFNDIPQLLKERFEELGASFAVKRFSGRIAKETATIYSRPIEVSASDIENNDKAKYYRFSGNMSGTFKGRKKGEYIFDFLRFTVSGINLGGGGSGGDDFSFGFTMWLDDFPKIKANHDEYLVLAEKNNILMSKKKHLEAEYQEYLKWKAFADIFWAVHNQERKELEKRLEEVKKILEARYVELDNERKERIFVEPDFDIERFKELKYKFDSI